MAKDKYAAVWVSPSSINDFLKCPRAYYLNNIYKDPHTGNKISLINPPLALGQAVHEVIESLSTIPTETRFDQPLTVKFNQAWQKIEGERGGFKDADQEHYYKTTGLKMLQTVQDNPGPLAEKAIKINMDLPHYWLSEEDNIILCGKIDWLEYLPNNDGVHIIDFKTGKQEENPNSLQLPIYHLLVQNCQNRTVEKASYWYLRQGSRLTAKKLSGLKEAKEAVLKIAKQIKLARQLERFKCPNGRDGCPACQPLEAIVQGEARQVGVNGYKQDLYILDKPLAKTKEDSIIL